ncbi:hypothetical protein [Planktothrix pseudagardhii]|uniref:Uncharacterized protein n=1 Tax=Planktothrix pseudagardhii TaxID=132604 RepID=A0A9W4CTT4_9CYAN|nr:hypothetical protein [Planktothrix pseudagardhii]CAD5985320.1 hypothetical protein NO713_05388 [Planktothrix pseudagardhii]
MINDAQNPELQAEWDLLNCLFLNESPYPWNPPMEVEAYLLKQEAPDFLVEAFTDAELAESSQRFIGQINQLWLATSLQTSLLQRFAEQIPHELLHRLVQVTTQITQQVSSQSLSLADQLVYCVQELLPQWSEEDLQVLARPFAYAMRGGKLEEMEVGSEIVGSVCWSELSEIEQARTCFVIARYALSEILSAQENA